VLRGCQQLRDDDLRDPDHLCCNHGMEGMGCLSIRERMLHPEYDLQFDHQILMKTMDNDCHDTPYIIILLLASRLGWARYMEHRFSAGSGIISFNSNTIEF